MITSQKTKTIYTPSFVVFCLELEEAIKEGYSVDVESAYNCPVAGLQYEATLVKAPVVYDAIAYESTLLTKPRMGRPPKGKP